MAVQAETPIELINGVYATLDQRLGAMPESVLVDPLTLAEKILASITCTRPTQELERGESYVDLVPRPGRHARRHRSNGVASVR